MVYICQHQSPNSSHPLIPLGVSIFVLYICISVSVWQMRSAVPFFTPLQYSCLENPMDGGAW